MLVNPTENGIRADVRPSLETFARLASLDALIRDRVATRVDLVPVSDALDWPEFPDETRLGAVSLPNSRGPSPGDVERIAAMIAADLITWIDSSGPSPGRIGIQLRISVDGKGLEISYQAVALEY